MLHIEKPGRFFIDVMLKTIFVWDSMSRNDGCDCFDSEVSSRWMSLLRAYQCALSKHLSIIFWYRCIMSILLFSHIPIVGHLMSILVVTLFYIRTAYCTLTVRIGIRAASTLFEIWFAFPLVSSSCAPSNGAWHQVSFRGTLLYWQAVS
jgi:hypothetical protein